MGRAAGVSPEQRRALGRLTAIRALDGFYLAGGTAIAVHLGHRKSHDLDLFSSRRDVDLGRVLDAVRPSVSAVLATTDAVLRVRVASVPVDIVRSPYPPFERPKPGPEGFPIAGLRDLGAMKLAAIAKRGLRRDFWDLWAIADAGIPLRQAARVYVRRFGVGQADLYHVARALTWFEDAEAEEAFPRGLSPRRWNEIKRFFEQEAPALLRR